jgi:hypothetical protein
MLTTALQMSPSEARNQNFDLTISLPSADRLSDITARRALSASGPIEMIGHWT